MTTRTQVFKNIVQRQIFNCKNTVEREISNCKMTEEPTMAIPEEAAQNECNQARGILKIKYLNVENRVSQST